MAILDELSERDGAAERRENRAYQLRFVPLANQVCHELYPLSDDYAAAIGRRGVPTKITSLDDTVPLDEFLCVAAMPYALAARLVVDENPTVAAFWERKFQESLARYGSATPREFEPITDVYGGLEPPNGAAV
jgi:hypothetical protein